MTKITALDHKPFLDKIEENPADAAIKLIYSDWLLEHGSTTASTVWRWLGMTGRYPGKYVRNYINGFDVIWFGFGDESDLNSIIEFNGSQCCLPSDLLSWIEHPWGDYDRKKMAERSAIEAVQAIVKIWDEAVKKRIFYSRFIPKWDQIYVVSKEEAEYQIKLKGII
jgi:uncharacterized protein (TIGR02996 family)